MNVPAIKSSIDVAYWFLARAEDEGLYLEDEKLHHLLFLTQVTYAKDTMQMFMPCLFMCGEKGFFEPNIKTIFANGRPFMPKTKTDETQQIFLETVWNKYKQLSILQLNNIVMNTSLFNETYRKGVETVVSWNSLVDKSREYGTIREDDSFVNKTPKILFSQNGPVLVSQWKPRKVTKGEL